MRTGAILALVVALLDLSAGPVAAQTALVGQRVRVTVSESTRRVVGELVSADRKSVVLLEGGSRRAIAAGSVEKLERSTGRHRHTGRGALIGSLGAVGIVGLDMIAHPQQCRGSGNYGQLCAAKLGISTLAGAAVGAVIGAAIRHNDWIEVSPELSGVGGSPASASLTFRFKF